MFNTTLLLVYHSTTPAVSELFFRLKNALESSRDLLPHSIHRHCHLDQCLVFISFDRTNRSKVDELFKSLNNLAVDHEIELFIDEECRVSLYREYPEIREVAPFTWTEWFNPLYLNNLDLLYAEVSKYPQLARIQ